MTDFRASSGFGVRQPGMLAIGFSAFFLVISGHGVLFVWLVGRDTVAGLRT